MKKTIIKFTTMTIAALAIAALPLNAADQPEKAGKPEKAMPAGAEKSGRAIPFHGKLAAKAEASITVGARIFEVTSDTKIIKDGKPATLADGVVGEDVGGQYRDEGGKLVAKSIRFGAKPEKAKDAEKPEKKARREKKAE